MVFSTPRMTGKKLSRITKTTKLQGSFIQIVLLECEVSSPAKHFPKGIYKAIL